MSTLDTDTTAALVEAYQAEPVTAAALAARFELPYDTVRGVLRDAGIGLRVSGFALVPRPNATQAAQIIADYEAGRSVAELAARFGFSQKIVKGLLREAGALQVGRRRSNRYPSTVTLARLAIEYAASNVTVKELAEREGFKPRLLAEALRASGTEIRPHRGSEPNVSFDEATRGQIAADYRAGAGLSDLQRRYRCGVERLYEALASQGVATRRRGRPRVERPAKPLRHPDNPRRDRKVRSVDVVELIEAGALLTGPVEWRYKGRVVAGELLSNGMVKIAEADEPLTLGGASHLLNGRWDSGYVIWNGSNPQGEIASLNTIRNRYLASLTRQDD